MSTLNLNMTPGYQWTSDSLGRIRYTKTRSNLAATPSGTVDLSNAVAMADIKDSNVTAAKLSNAVADAILTAVATVGDEATGAHTVAVSIQVKDIQGNNLAEVCAIELWFSDTAGAVLAAAPTTVAIAGSVGVILVAASATLIGVYLTNASGQLNLTCTQAGNLTKYCNLIVGGKYVAGSKAMVWVA